MNWILTYDDLDRADDRNADADRAIECRECGEWVNEHDAVNGKCAECHEDEYDAHLLADYEDRYIALDDRLDSEAEWLVSAGWGTDEDYA